MTNILAVLTILTVTNWESVGTFTDKKGQQFDVVEGVRCTNWTATFEFEGRQIGFVLKSARGDKCDEVKNLIPPKATIDGWTTNNFFIMTNYFHYTNSFLNQNITPVIAALDDVASRVKHVDGTNVIPLPTPHDK